jgi:hypothetical protein
MRPSVNYPTDFAEMEIPPAGGGISLKHDRRNYLRSIMRRASTVEPERNSIQ